DQPRRAGKVHGAHVIGEHGLLIQTLLEVFQGSEHKGLKSEVKAIAEGEYIAKTTSCVVECAKILQQQGRAILEGAESGRVDHRAVIILKKGLIRQHYLGQIAWSIPACLKVLLGARSETEPLVVSLDRHRADGSIARPIIFGQIEVLSSEAERLAGILVLLSIQRVCLK